MTGRSTPTRDELAARRAIVAAVQRLDALGLNVNSSGNLSVRLGKQVLLTPSAVPARDLTTDHLVVVGADGVPAEPGQHPPTSEWRLHLAIYAARPSVAAIVHTHSPEATAAAALGRPLPAIHYVVARFGATELPCAAYATYGTSELAANVVTALGGTGTACLMANHGAIAVGADLSSTVALALDVEWFCGVHRRAVAQGVPTVLPADEIAAVADRFTHYGRSSSRDR